MRRKENGMFTRVLSILLTSPSTTFRSRRRRMGTREVRTVSEEWKEWRTERTERVPLPTSLRSSRRLLTSPPSIPLCERNEPEEREVKWHERCGKGCRRTPVICFPVSYVSLLVFRLYVLHSAHSTRYATRETEHTTNERRESEECGRLVA